MTKNEAINKHIEECQHRIDNIKKFMESNEDADIDVCSSNIYILETAIQTMNSNLR